MSAATLCASLTGEGAILGTLQYMAQEQLEGKDADARTDIFAVGALVYEMATGRRAFEGKSQASLIGAILKDEPPPMSTLQTMTPPALDYVVKTCWRRTRMIGGSRRGMSDGRSRGSLRVGHDQAPLSRSPCLSQRGGDGRQVLPLRPR